MTKENPVCGVREICKVMVDNFKVVLLDFFLKHIHRLLRLTMRTCKVFVKMKLCHSSFFPKYSSLHYF